MIFAVMRYLLLSIALGLVMVSASGAAEQKLMVDGMEVFYGIVPLEIVKKTADKHGSDMHGRRSRKNFRHLVVTLVDGESGQRIADATIDATVTPLGLASKEKRLEPMRIDQTITYGNFFEFPADSAPFRIVLKITRPNRPTHSAAFEYRP